MILTDEMLMAAFRYRETNLWEWLDDSMVFAFVLSDGETGYCSVMGNAGEHLSLGFYRGAKGFATYLKTIGAGDMPKRELFEQYLTYDCINCDFMNSADASGLDKKAKERIKEFAKAKGFKIRRPNGWPDFTRYAGNKVQKGIVNHRDAQDITEALNAAVAMAKQLETPVWTTHRENLYDKCGFDLMHRYPTSKGGKIVPLLIPKDDGTYSLGTTKLPPLMKDKYENVTFSNDIAVYKLKTMQHIGTWECRFIHVPQIVNEPGAAFPYYPSLLLFVNVEDHFTFPVMPNEPVDENPQALLSELFGTFTRMDFCPNTLHVCDDKTKALLSDFCMKTGILICTKKSLPALDYAWDYVLG